MNEWMTVDNNYVKGGIAKLNTLTYMESATLGYGIYFNGSMKLDLNPVDLDNETVTEFLVATRFKPWSISETGDTLINIDDGTVVITLSRNATGLVYFYFYFNFLIFIFLCPLKITGIL